MSGLPDVPQIRFNPQASLSTLEFWWQAPLNNGGALIQNYTLLCSSISYSTIIGPSSFYAKVTPLVNSQDHTFQLAASNTNGLGPYIAFTTAQPGIRPVGITNLAVSTLNLSSANVVWNFTQSVNESLNKYFVMTVIPSTQSAEISTFQLGIYPNQRSQLVSNLSTMNYTFLVQSVNDANYSFPNASTIKLISAAFLPSVVGGLQSWLDGNDPLGNGAVPTNGASFTNWIDKSGNSRNLVWSNASGTYENGSINSLNAVRVNATIIGNVSIPAGTFSSNYCGFIVTRTLSGGQVYFGRTDNGGWGTLDVYGDQRYVATAAGTRVGLGLGINLAGQSNTTLWNFTLTNYASTGGTGVYNEWLNGSPVTMTGGGQQTGLNAVDFTNNLYFVGRAGVAVATNAYFCEILIYNTNLSSTNRQMIEGYLAWKWGTTASLPAGHPYKSAPP